jgi:hypothetical protein
MIWKLLLFLNSLLLIYNAGWFVVLFFLLSNGEKVVTITEPNLLIARIELVFSVSIVVLGFVGIYAITRVRK